MASNRSPSPDDDEPPDIDFSVIRTAIQMDHKMIDQILHGIHYGSDEVRGLLRQECDFIMECKVCRNLFRSFPNFVAHKRVYCTQPFAEKIEVDSLAPIEGNSETIIVQPEEVDARDKESESSRNTASSSTIDAVVNKTFDGKSKDYQFYTKVAENVEKQKAAKIKTTTTLSSIPTNPNAVLVSHSDGDNVEEVMREYRTKQALEREKQAENAKQMKQSPPKKNTLADVCAGLANQSYSHLDSGQRSKTRQPEPKKLTRSRKSSPRKSVEYMSDLGSGSVAKGSGKTGKNGNGASVDMEGVEEWKDMSSKASANDRGVNDKEWMKYCDIQKSTCKVCNKHFSSIYSLKFHAKMKHVGAEAQYQCPECSMSFTMLDALARHLRGSHHLPDSVINNIKLKLHVKNSDKSPDETDTDTDDVASTTSDKSTKEKSGKLLSYSTGWKKCDKCDKVFWKAKSYYRHKGSCKGATSSVSQKGTKKGTEVGDSVPVIDESVKSQETIVVGPKGKILMRTQNKELLKLQEKLRAKALTTTVSPSKTQGPHVSTNSPNHKANSKDAVVTENKKDTRSNDIAMAESELYKALVTPLPLKNALVSIEKDTSLDSLDASAPVKSNSPGAPKLKETSTMHTRGNAALKSNSPQKTKDDHVEQTEQQGEDIDANNKNTNEFRKLEVKLTRQAGLNEESEIVTDVTEVKGKKVYSLRHGSQKKAAEVEVKDKAVSEQGDKSESCNVEMTINLKSPHSKSGTPEMQELQVKLAREALGQAKNEGVPSTRSRNNSEPVSSCKGPVTLDTEKLEGPFPQGESKVERRSRSSEKAEMSNMVEFVRSSRHSSDHVHKQEREIDQRSERQRGRSAGTASICSRRESSDSGNVNIRSRRESETDDVASKRHFRSVSQGEEYVGRVGERTPEKLSLSTNASPVSHFRRKSFPTSPTPSLHSNSGDGYNLKFKMSVQEMAELVESASLTKFAKDRKKKARNILTKKQVKDSQKVSPALSKPMKRKPRPARDVMVVKSVYGTRFAAAKGEDCTKGVDEGIVVNVGSKRLSLEQKRLQNSAGFVGEKLHATTSAAESTDIVEKIMDTPKEVENTKLAKELKKLESSFHVAGALSRRSLETGRESARKSDTAIQPDQKHAPSRDSSNESRLSREIKKLASSTGFVEEKYYASSSRESSRERGTDAGAATEKTSKIPREIKHLQSSVGFVDKNLYVDGDRSSDHESETSSVGPTRERKRQVSLPEDVGKRFRNTSGSSCESKERYPHQPRGDNRDHARDVAKDQSKGTKHQEQQSSKVSPQGITGTAAAATTSTRSTSIVKNENPAIKNENPAKATQNTEDKAVHRTRLSTGSIYFDSELLKLSPTKIEKKIAEEEARRGKLSDQAKLDKSNTCKRLNLSPRSPRKVESAGKKAPPFKYYPLSTGYRQCKICGKKFWKQKSFLTHMRGHDSKLKAGKKRTLSLSPKDDSGQQLGGSGVEDKAKELHSKKARLEMDVTSSDTESRRRRDRNSGKFTKKVKDGKGNNVRMKDIAGSSDHVHKQEEGDHDFEEVIVIDDESEHESTVKKLKDDDSPIFHRNLKTDSGTSKASPESRTRSGNGNLDISASLNSATSNKQSSPTSVQNKGSKGVSSSELSNIQYKDSSSKLSDAQSLHSETKRIPTSSAIPPVVKDSYKAVAVATSLSNDTVDVPPNVTSSSKSPSNTTTDTINMKSKPTLPSAATTALVRATLSPAPSTSTPNTEVTITSLTPSTSITSETTGTPTTSANISYETTVTAGPSGLNVSCTLSDDSDGNCSEFSGFSEDDLKMTEVELSAHLDNNNQNPDHNHTVDLEADDLSELGDLDFSTDEDDLDDSEVAVDRIHEEEDEGEANDGDNSNTATRPIRKSAQNRFGHVEEIWVYKEPGKPIERVKGSGAGYFGNTREYVLDVDHPTKLNCHSTRDVERLIDEKNLKCKQCDTPCMSISNLRRHVIGHLGWKRYKCQLCTYTCYDKSRCIKHCQLSHNKTLTDKNFSTLVRDLKKEATRLRNKRRTTTMRKTKRQIIEDPDDIYQKPKPVLAPKAAPSQLKSPKTATAASDNQDALASPVTTEEESVILKKARIGLAKALTDK